MLEKIGFGILSWDAKERRSNRYGRISLYDSSYDSTGRCKPEWNSDVIEKFVDKKVRLVAVVIEDRDSGHLGDLFLGISPTRPKAGDIIEIGVGPFYADCPSGEFYCSIEPSDGRLELWIDPRILYRLHDQTVELYVEETDEEETPVADLSATGDSVVSAGGGFV